MRKLFLPLALLLVTACGESKFHQSVDYAIFVDSIQVPAVVSSNQPFTIRFFGEVGPDQCWNFNGFNSQKDARRLDILVLGRYVSTERCPQIEVKLDGEPFDVQPPFEDPFTVRVTQPNGDSLVVTIPVR
ncbi:MAG: hypothetical protein H0W11_01240 [Gemmatimonadetes bacterium]|jgi:hypothetical protein|nr:hypothetical protein [Gemmatimonadota bacterium]